MTTLKTTDPYCMQTWDHDAVQLILIALGNADIDRFDWSELVYAIRCLCQFNRTTDQAVELVRSLLGINADPHQLISIGDLKLRQLQRMRHPQGYFVPNQMITMLLEFDYVDQGEFDVYRDTIHTQTLTADQV